MSVNVSCFISLFLHRFEGVILPSLAHEMCIRDRYGAELHRFLCALLHLSRLAGLYSAVHDADGLFRLHGGQPADPQALDVYKRQEGTSVVVAQFRVPRIVLAVLCGMGLALAGCVMQTVTGNPLADPGILGINAGAGFAVMLFLTFFPALHIRCLLYTSIHWLEPPNQHAELELERWNGPICIKVSNHVSEEVAWYATVSYTHLPAP